LIALAVMRISSAPTGESFTSGSVRAGG
jgi:hypothetical protein